MISIFLPDLRGGGAERVNIDLAYEFVRAGHKVQFVLMRAEGALLGEVSASFSIVDLATPRTRNLPFTLAHYLRHQRPHALIAAMWPLTVIGPISQRLSGHYCKVLVSEHNTLSVQYGDWGRLHRASMQASMALGYRLADCRVGVSAGVAQDIAELSGLGSEAIKVIHNPITQRESTCAKLLEEAEALWSGERGSRIVTVGSMKAQKNHPLLLRAFSRLKSPNSRLMFVGEGEGRDALSALADELNVAEKVIFAGFRADPTPFYETADLFALSSNYEGFGNVIVEALATGTPVVSTNCPYGPAEILENGRWGRLTPVGDEDALAEAMHASLEDDHHTAALMRRANDFSPKIAARKYLELLDL